MTTFRHVDKGRNDAINLVVHGAVGTDTNEIPAALTAAYFPLYGGQIIQDRPGIRNQTVIIELMSEVGDGPTGWIRNACDDRANEGDFAL